MVLNKNKSEIATSFRNLLRKADEMALEKKMMVTVPRN